LKVLNVLEEGRWGGPQKRVLLVARELKKQGIETVVVIPKSGTQMFQDKLKLNQISYYAINLHRLTKDRKHLLSYFYYFRKEIQDMKKIIRKESIDIVHVNGSFQIKGVFAAKQSGIKSVWHLNDTYVIKPIKILFENFLKHRTDAFFVAGERVRAYYLKNVTVDKPITSVSPPVELDEFNPKNNFSKVLDQDVLNVTLVANWSQIKGHGTFIKMASYIADKRKDFKVQFNIVGKKIDNQIPYYNRMMALIKSTGIDSINIMGQREDVVDILSCSDVSICSSNFEASPTTVWEAMAMAKPIVSTDVGDVKPYFQIYNCGHVVDVGDYEAMGDKVIQLLENPVLRKKLGKRARKAAEVNFGLDAIAEKHAKTYKKILEKKFFN